MRASGVLEVRHDHGCLDEPGFWVVVASFEGDFIAARMAHVSRDSRSRHVDHGAQQQHSPAVWRSSLTAADYQSAVVRIRELIAAGEVYQVNLCRVLSRELPAGASLDVLNSLLWQRHPSRYAARIHISQADLDVVSASPELFLARTADVLRSGPIKGTAISTEAMLAKDYTENVMITDLVRNDLSTVCAAGSVEVRGLCVPEAYYGSVHLVSTVAGRLRPGVSWSQILTGTFPPGSVSGAPKTTALQAIRALEPIARGPYCGAIGYVDNNSSTARLAVGIRTFWATSDGDGARTLNFGTGAGITWGSDPLGEWEETELKAARLIRLADDAFGGDAGQ
ncbi:chorismate-binding protein [Rudaeicoccus suwonensis]|uniref:chorismate-binding protein n=1 Tax=Rudaeicoccus suwonensis TaxID=657409 RepID=UPI001FEBE164|nr:chorismate-binding protein [Rudaeicoccus suwonensis]